MAAVALTELRPLPPELKIEAHLVELESMGYTVVRSTQTHHSPTLRLSRCCSQVDDAIPPATLKRLQENHRQMMRNIKEHKPEEEWSWESDNDGLVDWCVTVQGPAPFLAVHSACTFRHATRFRLYDLDWAYEELLTLPKVYPIIERAIKEGRGRPGHEGGPRLYHEMAQHLPAGTPGGQSWHRCGHRRAHRSACCSQGMPALRPHRLPDAHLLRRLSQLTILSVCAEMGT